LEPSIPYIKGALMMISPTGKTTHAPSHDNPVRFLCLLGIGVLFCFIGAAEVRRVMDAGATMLESGNLTS
jgi:hypothetical protein